MQAGGGRTLGSRGPAREKEAAPRSAAWTASGRRTKRSSRLRNNWPAFRERSYAAAAEAVAGLKLAWLTATQRKGVTGALEAEIDRLTDRRRAPMPEILARSLAALVEPLTAARRTGEAPEAHRRHLEDPA